MATDEQARPRDLLEGVEHYTPDLVDLEPKHPPETIARRRGFLAAERPFIERFGYADTCGHAPVTVRGDVVPAEGVRGLGHGAWKALDLAGPPGRVPPAAGPVRPNRPPRGGATSGTVFSKLV